MLTTKRAGSLVLLVAIAAGVPACIFETGSYQGGGRTGTGAKPPDDDGTGTPASTSTSTSTSTGSTDSGGATDTGADSGTG